MDNVVLIVTTVVTSIFFSTIITLILVSSYINKTEKLMLDVYDSNEKYIEEYQKICNELIEKMKERYKVDIDER